MTLYGESPIEIFSTSPQSKDLPRETYVPHVNHYVASLGPRSGRSTLPSLALINKFLSSPHRGLIGHQRHRARIQAPKKATMDELWAAKVCRVANVMRPYLESF
jgi:hypothetical protein